MARLAPKTKVLRDGHWSEQDASILVPGDIISAQLGDIISADVRLLIGDPLKIDQTALTGESMPVTKKPADEVFSESMCKQGEIEAVVIATGVHTFFGKAAHDLVDSTNQVGHFSEASFDCHWKFLHILRYNVRSGSITKRLDTAIEEMARMDVFCISDKTGTLTLNKLITCVRHINCG
ncbi:hypothetical protein L7F22_053489 [Adiantum nelumboides]|nr:hypothetical protein [Adiantum nelumboides]